MHLIQPQIITGASTDYNLSPLTPHIYKFETDTGDSTRVIVIGIYIIHNTLRKDSFNCDAGLEDLLSHIGLLR